MNKTKPWARFLLIAGYVAMLVGAIDPMEGAFIILPGIGLVALGTYFSDESRSIYIVRLWAFMLVLFGVGALIGFSMLGGIGGDSGYSGWWALLCLPYPIGWSMGIWGPGAPRWVLWPGIVVGLWYLFPGSFTCSRQDRCCVEWPVSHEYEWRDSYPSRR